MIKKCQGLIGKNHVDGDKIFGNFPGFNGTNETKRSVSVLTLTCQNVHCLARQTCRSS